MDDGIELIYDGDGLAVVGNPLDVERFLAAEGLESKDLGLGRIGSIVRAGSAVAQAGSEIAANSGRWVKLTKDSAEAVKKFGLMTTKSPGISHAMVGKPGDIQRWIQIVTAPGSLVTNPAVLSGAAGIMSQLAMQQAMDEITDYLAIIDEKLDDLLRAQKNQVLAGMDGVDFAIREAATIRNAVGRISEVTWSKVQGSSAKILETQAYALRQLEDLAAKVERKVKVDELLKIVAETERDVQKWLAVLARCFQLHDAVAVLELDRVLDAAPDELDRHRVGLKAARLDRLDLISKSTEHLLARMNAAVETANSKVLFNPIQSPAVVEASNRVVSGVQEFNDRLGIEAGGQSSEARRWMGAAAEKWGKVRETGSEGLDTVKHLGSETRDQARSVKGKLSGRLAERKLRRHESDNDDDELEGVDSDSTGTVDDTSDATPLPSSVASPSVPIDEIAPDVVAIEAPETNARPGRPVGPRPLP